MRRMAIVAALAALTALGGCAQRDPNLQVKSLAEFGRVPGDYTLSLSAYGLGADGRATLAAADDPSLRGFVTRTLGAKGYAQKASGPAGYAVEVHLLCADTRAADKGILAEEILLPAGAAGPGQSSQVHYWLPDQGPASGQVNQDALGRREIFTQSVPGARTERNSQSAQAGGALARQAVGQCQGRVLVALTAGGAGPKREVFVGRAATEDGQTVAGCPVDACRNALEQTLVNLLDRRF